MCEVRNTEKTAVRSVGGCVIQGPILVSSVGPRPGAPTMIGGTKTEVEAVLPEWSRLAMSSTVFCIRLGRSLLMVIHHDSARPFRRTGLSSFPQVISSRSLPASALVSRLRTRRLPASGAGLWGEDLDLEVARALLLTTFDQNGDQRGWNIMFLEPSKLALTSEPTEEPWSPAFVSLEEFVVLERLCAGGSVSMDDTELLA
jgi:hypothetical protein